MDVEEAQPMMLRDRSRGKNGGGCRRGRQIYSLEAECDLFLQRGGRQFYGLVYIVNTGGL
jgi:hypothetical protein